MGGLRVAAERPGRRAAGAFWMWRYLLADAALSARHASISAFVS